MENYWAEYLPEEVGKRFLLGKVRREDLAIIIATFHTYRKPEWTIEMCVDVVIEQLCAVNEIDLDPNNLDFDDLARQAKEIQTRKEK